MTFISKRYFLLTLCVSFLIPLFSTSAYEKVTDFSFKDLKGEQHKFSDYKGKWVLVNYWATYCPPCLAEMPDIERFSQDNKDRFVALGLDAGGSSPQDIIAFAKDNGISYPLIPMQESTMLAFGYVMAIPTSYVISPKGEIVEKYVGIITYDDLDYFVNPPIFDKNDDKIALPK